MRLALAGDTMLGRNVGARLAETGDPLWSPGVRAEIASADLAVCNLECCISDGGARWPDPDKPFFFRAPPQAAEALADLGVDAVTLANNHALDYGYEALTDTLAHLERVGITAVGAGADEQSARRPAVLDAEGLRLGLVGIADHPADYAAQPRRPGIAYAPLDDGVPRWTADAIAGCDADVVVITPHWGPNMVHEPVPHVRAAAAHLAAAGAHVVAGHSAHCFHGVARIMRTVVCFDLGDFIDDYAVHPQRRNDLGLLWILDLRADGLHHLEAVPLALDYCSTRLADDAEASEITQRLRAACAEFGVDVRAEDGRLVVDAAPA